MRSKLTPPVYDREEHYERSTRLIRWVCLLLVLITFPFATANGIVVITVLIVSSVYNALRYNARFRRLTLFSARANSLAVDHIFVLSIVLLSGGLASPYYPLFFLLIIGMIASYGIAGFTFSLSAQVLVTLSLLQVNNDALPSTPEYQFIIKLIFLIVFSLVAEQSVRSRDEEYLLETHFTSTVQSDRQRLLALINSLSSGVLAVNEAGLVYLYNAAALELLNTNQNINEVKLNSLLRLKDEKQQPVDILELMRTMDRVCNRQDLTYEANDGSKTILDLTLAPVRLSGLDSTGGYIVVFHDITKQKSLDEQRDEFISVASHELRTPLAIAEANLSTALLPGFAKIDSKARNLLDQTHENLVFLSELITDLTTLSRAERGELDLEEEMVDVHELAEELHRDYQPQAAAKGLIFTMVVSPEVKNIVTSAHAVREILQNFLTNSIKYTTAGSLTLTAERTEQGTLFSVKDTGIGISASDKTKVFAKFYRSEDYRTRLSGGTGLGLYITHKLAERLGGEITFSSKLNHGSTFRLLVPPRVTFDEARVVAQKAQFHTK